VIALTRPVPAGIAQCELTHLAREPIDLARARSQHAAYERALADAGCAIERLPADDAMADSVFVEDAAIVFDELAVITRPGAVSRRGETPTVARALEAYRPLAYIREPATIDGGGVYGGGYAGKRALLNAWCSQPSPSGKKVGAPVRTKNDVVRSMCTSSNICSSARNVCSSSPETSDVATT